MMRFILILSMVILSPTYVSADVLYSQTVDTVQDGETGDSMGTLLFATSSYATCEDIPEWTISSFSLKTYDDGVGPGPQDIYGGVSVAGYDGTLALSGTLSQYHQATSTNKISIDGDAGTVRTWTFSPSVYLPSLCEDAGGSGYPAASDYYWIRVGIGALGNDNALDVGETPSVNSSASYERNASASASDLYMVIEGVEISGGTGTRIETVTPYDGETIATSSAATFGATGWVSEEDWEYGTVVELQYAPYSAYQAAVATPDMVMTYVELEIAGYGAFSVSTTSSATVGGEYYMGAAIKTPSWSNSLLNFFGYGQFANFGVLTSTSTEFIAGYLTAYDIFVASTTESVENYLASSTVSMAACTEWTSFALQDCLNLLFVPQTQPIAAALGAFKEEFLSYAPWGYITRFVTIMASPDIDDLPEFSVTVPTDGEGGSMGFSMDMNEALAGAGDVLDSLEDPYSGTSVQDIMQPFVRLTLGLLVLLALIHHITATRHVDGQRV